MRYYIPLTKHLPVISSIFLLFCFYTINEAWAQSDTGWEDLRIYGGQVNALAVDPNDSSIIYAGTWGGEGLFKTIDSGKTWSAVPTDTSAWFKNIAVFDIAIDSNNPDNIWVANADYIDVSQDQGLTWQSLDFASLEGRLCFTVAVDQHDPSGSTVYAGTGGPDYTDEYGTVFKTTDAGETWQKTNLISDFDVYDLHINPSKPDEIWAACNTYQISPHGQICMTSDGGLSWTKWDFDWYIDELLIHPENPLLIFAAGKNGVIKIDRGYGQNTDWKNLNLAEICYSLCIPPADTSVLYAGLTHAVAKTFDLGTTWSWVESPGDLRTLVADPFNENIIYGGHKNRGLFKSANGAGTWSENNNGLRANAIFSSHIAPFDNSTILSGTFSGIYKSSDNNTWELLNPQPSEAALFDPHNSNFIYAGFDWKIGKSTDTGQTWEYVSIFDDDESYGISSLSVSPLLPETVFAGLFFFSGQRGCVIKSSDSGDHYNIVFDTSVPVNCVAVHNSRPGTVYAGTGDFYTPVTAGSLYKSTDNGQTWQKTSLRNKVVNSIALSKTDPDLIYAACGGNDYSLSGIFKSTDGGQTWQEMSYGLPLKRGLLNLKQLPDFSVTDIVIDSKNSAIVYAAFYDRGIYISLDAGKYWTQIGLPDYLIYTLSIRPHPPSGPFLARNSETAFNHPSGSVIAGTESGMYQFRTAGSGILSGTISSAQTGAPINEAVLSTSYGGTCISSNGYYLLMVPAGTHTVTAQAFGYLSSTESGIVVNAGESSTRDITLIAQSNNQTCPATLLLKGTKREYMLAGFRDFRDRVLSGNSFGRELIKYYNNSGNSLLKLIQKHSGIKKRCLTLLDRLMPLITSALKGNPLIIPDPLSAEIDSIVQDLSKISGDDLEKDFSIIMEAVRSKK